MARSVNRLSALAVSKQTKSGYYSDGGGLYLQVTQAGGKSWVLLYRTDGKRREMGLGSALTVSLAQARQAAAEYRDMVKAGTDPIDAREAKRAELAAERQKARGVLTFDQAAEAYIAAHRHEWRNEKHGAQWVATLKEYASPHFGSIPVNRIDTADILRALTPIWTAKTETATRVRGRIERVLDWARVAGYREGESPARWRGHLEHSLAAPSKVAKTVHHAALPWRQIGDFMADLRKREGVAARALEFAILCASRSGEVRMATWDEFDLTAKTWTIPGSRMKAGKEHMVPLSGRAIELLQEMPRIEGCQWVFPGAKNKPLSDMSLTAVLRRMGVTATQHGFRSSFRDWCAESVANSFNREVAEHALAHQLPDRVEAAYQRGTLFDRRVMLMAAWADYCSKPSVTTATVTAIRGAA
jgi:integrase